MVKIGIVGDVPVGHLHYTATEAALSHAAKELDVEIAFRWHATTEFLSPGAAESMKTDGVIAAPWSPNRSKEGTLQAIKFARENRLPLLAACGGMQHALVEFARNVLGIGDAEHAEYDSRQGTQVVTALSCSLVGKSIRVRLKEGSRVQSIYGRDLIEERTTCNYGLNPRFQRDMEEAGFRVSGTDSTGEARAMELEGHPFYVATLYVPQLTSTFENPHALFVAFLKAAATA